MNKTLPYFSEINELIEEIEKEKNIKIIFTSDCGSRTYGWFEKTSDFDLHFIYCHEPSWYVSIQNKPSAFEISKKTKDKIECNFTGWDVKHALFLISKSNPALGHALTSSSIYRDKKPLTDELINFCLKYYHHGSFCLSLINLAKQNIIRYIQDKKEVRVKIYLYLSHHLLYVRYFMKHHSFPPQQLNLLMKDLDNKEIIPYIFSLKRLKKNNISHIKRCVTLEIYILTLYKQLKKWARKEFHDKKNNKIIPFDDFDILLHKFIFPE